MDIRRDLLHYKVLNSFVGAHSKFLNLLHVGSVKKCKRKCSDMRYRWQVLGSCIRLHQAWPPSTRLRTRPAQQQLPRPQRPRPTPGPRWACRQPVPACSRGLRPGRPPRPLPQPQDRLRTRQCPAAGRRSRARGSCHTSGGTTRCHVACTSCSPAACSPSASARPLPPWRSPRVNAPSAATFPERPPRPHRASFYALMQRQPSAAPVQHAACVMRGAVMLHS